MILLCSYPARLVKPFGSRLGFTLNNFREILGSVPGLTLCFLASYLEIFVKLCGGSDRVVITHVEGSKQRLEHFPWTSVPELPKHVQFPILTLAKNSHLMHVNYTNELNIVVGA